MSDESAGGGGGGGGREARALKCPACAGAMETVAYGGVEVDRCAACKGLWFDALEREKLKDVKGSEAVDVGKPAAAGTAAGATAEKGADDKRRIDCPVCHTRMIRMVDVDQPHIHYESCTVCFGVFFDAGEFRDYKENTVGDWMKRWFSRERT